MLSMRKQETCEFLIPLTKTRQKTLYKDMAVALKSRADLMTAELVSMGALFTLKSVLHLWP